MVPINYWAVLVAAVVDIIIGSLWYGPIFGKAWMSMVGMTPDRMEREKAGMGKFHAFMALSALVISDALAHSIVFGAAYLNISDLSAGLQAGFWSWLGFAAPVVLGITLSEKRSWKYWFLTAGYYLVAFLIMGAILGAWM